MTDLHGFELLDQAHARHAPTPADWELYGRYSLAHGVLLDTPDTVSWNEERITNPSQLLEDVTVVNGQETNLLYAYFRQEPIKQHLGRTQAVPYIVSVDGPGAPRIAGIHQDLAVIPGEDARVTPGVRMKGHLGVHEGMLVSTIHAQPSADNPNKSGRVQQLFYWGESPRRMEVVAEGPVGFKDTAVCAAYQSNDDTALDLFGRPWPDISYSRIGGLEELTPEVITSPQHIITAGLLPEGVSCGPQLVKARGPHHREIDVHETYKGYTPDGRKILHYRLGRYGFELPNENFANGRLVALGTLATRASFPDATPKDPTEGIADFYDIVYGPIGYATLPGSTIRYALAGVGDNRAGMAVIMRAD